MRKLYSLTHARAHPFHPPFASLLPYNLPHILFIEMDARGWGTCTSRQLRIFALGKGLVSTMCPPNPYIYFPQLQ